MAFNFQALTKSPVWTSDDILIEEPRAAESFIELNIDPLVLSCCQYRLSDPNSEDYNPTGAFTSLNHNPSYLYDKVNQDDYDLAEKIRKYYQGKIMFAKLRGSQMSKFRQDLAKFIDIRWGEVTKISDSYLGMIYKLPYFYHHDFNHTGVSLGRVVCRESEGGSE